MSGHRPHLGRPAISMWPTQKWVRQGFLPQTAKWDDVWKAFLKTRAPEIHSSAVLITVYVFTNKNKIPALFSLLAPPPLIYGALARCGY